MTPAHWLRILVYQDLPGIWVARSLEHDIAVEGVTSEAAIDWILRIVSAHVEFDQRHGRSPLASFPEAPERYWQAFSEATPIRTISQQGRRHGSDERAIQIAVTHQRPSARFRLPQASSLAPFPSERTDSGRLPTLPAN